MSLSDELTECLQVLVVEISQLPCVLYSVVICNKEWIDDYDKAECYMWLRIV